MSKALLNSLRVKAEEHAVSSPTKRKRSHHCFVLKDEDKDIVIVVATSEYEHRESIRPLVNYFVAMTDQLTHLIVVFHKLGWISCMERT